MLNPAATFVYNYFFRLGFLDGREGLLLHLNHSVYIHWKFIKAWRLGQGKDDPYHPDGFSPVPSPWTLTFKYGNSPVRASPDTSGDILPRARKSVPAQRFVTIRLGMNLPDSSQLLNLRLRLRFLFRENGKRLPTGIGLPSPAPAGSAWSDRAVQKTHPAAPRS